MYCGEQQQLTRFAWSTVVSGFHPHLNVVKPTYSQYEAVCNAADAENLHVSRGHLCRTFHQIAALYSVYIGRGDTRKIKHFARVVFLAKSHAC